MRVAYVCTDPGVPIFGNKGASVHAQSVLGVLVDGGAEVHLLTSAATGPPPRRLTRLRTHPLPRRSDGPPAEREASARRADASVAPVLDAVSEPDRLDLVYERYSLWGGSAMAWAAEHRVPSVLEVNAPLVEEQARHRVLVDRVLAERIARETLSRAGTVVCVSDRVAEWAAERSRHPERVHVVANGVDTRRVRPTSAPPVARPFTVGFVGTLKPWHGVDDLVSAVSLLARTDDSYRLLLVGDGPQGPALRAQIHALHLDDVVEMTGAVPPDQVPALLQRMHVAVAPYPHSDGFYFSPLKIYEYLAAGLPVVATRIGDLPAVLEDGALGVLVEPGDPSGIAAAIGRLRDDPVRRTTLGRAARRAAVARHDWAAVVSRTLALSEVFDGAA